VDSNLVEDELDTGALLAGAHSWYRGASPGHDDDETRRCLAGLAAVDTGRATRVWEAAGPAQDQQRPTAPAQPPGGSELTV